MARRGRKRRKSGEFPALWSPEEWMWDAFVCCLLVMHITFWVRMIDDVEQGSLSHIGQTTPIRST